MPYDLGKDLIVPEAEKLLGTLKKTFSKFTDAVQNSLKESAARGALKAAMRASEVLTDLEGALNDALNDLEEAKVIASDQEQKAGEDRPAGVNSGK